MLKLTDHSDHQLIIKAVFSNPWQMQVVVEEQEDADEINAAGFSLIAQQLACGSAYGGDIAQDTT